MAKRIQPWYRYPWQKVRLEVLTRDGWLCQLRGEGCTIQAEAVDHIVSPLEGGAWWDHANLRASCSHCNNQRGERYGYHRARTPRLAAPSRDW